MAVLFLLFAIFVLLWGLYAAEKRPDCRCPPSSRELTGIWRQATTEPFVGYLYFTEDGAVYYMASRIPATESMFTDKFRLTRSRSGGAFSCWRYAARREADGQLLLSVSGKAIGGTYYKIT